MQTSETIQQEIENLTTRLRDFEARISSLQEDLDRKHAETAEAMLENRNTDSLEFDIATLERRKKTAELAREKLEVQIREANERLAQAKKKEGEARVLAINGELGEAIASLERNLEDAIISSKRIDALLEEGWRIFHTLGVPLSPLGEKISYPSRTEALVNLQALVSFYHPKEKAA